MSRKWCQSWKDDFRDITIGVQSIIDVMQLQKDEKCNSILMHFNIIIYKFQARIKIALRMS